MVEDNDNANSTNQDPAEQSHADSAAVKRRGRLFGGRRGSRKGAEPDRVDPATAQATTSAGEPAGAPPAQAEPSTTASGPAAEPLAGQQPAAERQRPATGQQSAAGRGQAPQEPADPGASTTSETAGDRVISHAAQAPGLPSSAILFQAPPVLPPAPGSASDDDEEDEEADETSATRRRTRRRSPESGRQASEERQRPQREEPVLITEPQKVKGSTRLEAKKQRRRDGRDAGRRRAVVTEAEFLARRESVDRQMVVRSKNGRIQIGVLEDGVLVEHYVARSQEASLIGNVYLGRVQNVLPSMEAAFVDIGRGRNAVLYSGEVDWDAAAENSTSGGSQPRRIELALKPGDKVLVQVTKDPVGHKGARLTSQVSLPGRYLVYVPNGSMNGISRKLPDTERARLKKILKAVLPENVGVIVRTAAEGATEEQLTLDVNRLTAQWAEISKQVESVQAPAMLHSEPDLLIKIVRDVFNEDFQKLIIAGDDARSTIENYLRQMAPDLLDRIENYDGDRDAFDQYRISEQIEKALERKVWLPSGGSLVIDRTEAMTVVDVNTGKFVGSGGNLEETVTKNNLEAAEEIVRQLRLRDIGGIIVVDFIDMVLESNRDLVLRRLVECLSRDRTKHQVAEVTSLGLVQMTRKKLGLGLLETFSEPCEVCAGRGVVVHHDPVVKHRAAPSQNERRRGKGGTNTGGAQQNGNGVTHAITDDAKNALAQIAASTLAHSHEAEHAEAPAREAVPAAQAVPDAVEVANEPSRAGASRRGRRATGSRDARATGEERADPVGPTRESTGSTDSGSGDEDRAPVAILDIPVASVAPAQKPRIDTREAEQLLDSVLEALPAPKQPGQGRGRSRRVTTAALTGTVITPEPRRDRPAE
ncbi:MAG TPA: Rne/Rng family ribonuclease [Humibacter sp.]|nr:Rne/Rng family ribonuclease [Humibacter sp.]